jgi:hypothetical protein
MPKLDCVHRLRLLRLKSSDERKSIVGAAAKQTQDSCGTGFNREYVGSGALICGAAQGAFPAKAGPTGKTH